MADLKYLGQGSFDMQLLDGRRIPYKTGDTVKNLPEDVASELLERTEGGKPTWEPAAGDQGKPPKTSASK
jgi:hypothetical protein